MNRKLNISSDVEEVARNAVDALFHLHTELGPGLLESAYAACFAEELHHRNTKFTREAAIPLK
jgi:GxxExxY protein